ncbi:MAG: CaiB/BaiF CoA-transferase family protein [Pseudomonadales bacterium]|jgi:crotonobetainyl-CoA:carnitine CoA-transferase CaiB-like acyl-CoA transferase
MKPMEGKLVVALEQAVAAPLCTSRLADAGARVIKIERKDVGDFARQYDDVVRGQSAYFVWLNRGKESLELDIKNEDDLNLLHSILSEADVFIQNLAPGAVDKIGLSNATLREKYPRLIICEISGYGDSGPYQDMKAYDLLVQAESGLASITGAREAPGRVGVSVCDIAAGMNALSGILLALLEREQSGVGQVVKVSLFDGMSDWMTVPLLHHEYGGKAPGRVGLNHPTIAPYGVYTDGDGASVLISIQNEREWKMFCEEILEQPDLPGRADFLSNTERVRNRPALDELINAVFSNLSTDVLSARLREARIAYGMLNEVHHLSDHPQLRRRLVASEAGDINLVDSPLRMGNNETNFAPIPKLGEHNKSIQSEFGGVNKETN